jgi:hypothetical protein
MTAWLLSLAVFLLLLATLAGIADWWDGRERRDARQRNHARRVR